MKVLTIGDVVGEAGIDTLYALLRRVKRAQGADFVIVNGENAAGRGITPAQADDIFSAGADVITLGNHAFGKRQIASYLDEHTDVLRPANLAPQSPGQGWGIYDGPQGLRLLVMNLLGRCDMPYGPDNPFLCADKILRDNEGKYDIALAEIHANATSEKLAMGYYLDGRAAAVWGTHTHVQTADNRINPKGTGYITDIGMTGPVVSVLGVCPAQSIAMFRGDLTEPFQTAPGECALSGAVFEIGRDGVCSSVTRVWERCGR
ncbi:TIGR00282 family metallophosphoesterase [Agathobaculum desmolans]|uniref:TIGR00282 family metallophosphoesterase n=1 Tax=Agathobaculum desmolans TaxID=39484 RepID=UPI0004E22B01|nr:TIGR00282 family metallophosphoesterase [Agathobaculum desmolans]